MEELHLKFKVLSKVNYQIELELYDDEGKLKRKRSGALVPFCLLGQNDEVMRRTCRAMALSFIDEMDRVKVKDKKLEGFNNNKKIKLIFPDKMVKVDFLYKAIKAKEEAMVPVSKRETKKTVFSQYCDNKYCKQICYPNGEVVKMDNTFENSLIHAVFIPEIYSMLRTDENIQREIEQTSLVESDGKIFYQIETVFGDLLEMEVKINYFEINGISFIEKLIFEDGYDKKKICQMIEMIKNKGSGVMKCKAPRDLT